MPTSHDLRQDQHLSDLDREVANLRKQIQANVRTINEVAKDLNARLAALEKSGQPTPAPAARPSRPKPRGPRPKTTPKGAKK